MIDPLLGEPGALEGDRERESLYSSRSFREACDPLVGKHGQRAGAGEYLRLLKWASRVGESDINVIWADDLSPPCPAWRVGAWRRLLQAQPKPQLEVFELAPEWRS